MGFEDLASELAKQAEAEGKKLLHAAEHSAKKMAEEAQGKAEETLRTAKKEASAYARQESSERLTSAKLSSKKILGEARDDAVEACLGQVWGEFRAGCLGKAAYLQLLPRLVSEGASELGTQDAIVFVRDSDRPLVAGFRLARLPTEYSGGAIVESQDGKIRVNKTFEELFSQKKGALRKQIYDKLF